MSNYNRLGILPDNFKGEFMHQKGFTILELMVVLAIISILSVLAVPDITAFTNRIHLETTARDLTSDLREMKMKAMIERDNFTISFDPENNSYDLPERKVYLPPEIRFGFGPGVLGPPEEDGVTFPSNKANFYPQGTNSMGTVYLTNNETLTMKITISITGRVRIWEWSEGIWK